MRSRREFLAGTIAGVFVPRVATAQQAGRAPRIGFLFYGSRAPAPEIEAFQKGLTQVGYVEAQNTAVASRFADGRRERLPELATQLVALKPTVIVAPGTPAAVAA